MGKQARTLKALVKLGCKVAVYIPSTIDVDQATDTARHVDKCLALLSGAFGGATSTPAIGAWIAETGKLVKEKITLVYAYCNSQALDKHIGAIIDYCETLKLELSQEAIALEVNGELYFL